jgi:hypothetical protein
MGSTHTWGGVNYANSFNISMTAVGILLMLLGTGLLVVSLTAVRKLFFGFRRA